MGHQTQAVTRALALIAGGLSAYAAARQCGIALSTIYRALKRERDRSVTATKGV